MSIPGSRFHDTKAAAAILDVSPSWLAKSRMDGSGPPHRKFGSSVKYEDEDLTDWADKQRVTTSDEAA